VSHHEKTMVVGNKFADAIAKHAALHNYGHDEAFQPPSPDGNPFAHVYFLFFLSLSFSFLSSIYTGLQKITMILLTLPLK